MKQIKISVIMPVYNAERFLESTVRQVMGQSLQEIEIICVDDGSTDRSLKILKKLAEEDPRIVIVSQDHQNAGAARNCGLRLAKGEYLSFLDADDLFTNDLLERAYAVATEKEAQIAVFRSDRYNERTRRFEMANWTIREGLLPKNDVFSHRDVEDFYYCLDSGWAWDKLFQTEFIRKLDLWFQEQRWINDRFFVECALSVAERITVLDEILIHKRVNHAEALTTHYVADSNWKYWFSAITAIQAWLKQRGLYGELKKDFLNFTLYYVLWNMDQFLESPAFPQMYECVKGEYLGKFGLENISADLLYRRQEFDQLQDIRRMDAQEYRWKRQLKRRDGTYLFPFELVPKGSRIILYGAGVVGRYFYRQIMFSGWCEVVAWVDRNVIDKGKRIVKLGEIMNQWKKISVDYWVIAINDGEIADRVAWELCHYDVPRDRIVWKQPEVQL